VLEADNDVIRIPQDDHVAYCFPPSPSIGPEIEDVVQVSNMRLCWGMNGIIASSHDSKS
jgi:hypothetical protein